MLSVADGEKQPKHKITFRIELCLTKRGGWFFSLNSQCVKPSTITIVRDNHKSLR